MEFATENYLNELLLNTEANGFESAKEAFYECIANACVLEGTENENSSSSSASFNESNEKSGFLSKLVEVIVKVLKLAWQILTFIPKWIFNKINDIAEKYKTMNNAADDINKLPTETRQAIANYINAAVDSFTPTCRTINDIATAGYMKRLNQIIAKGVGGISNTDATEGERIADEASTKINDAINKCSNEITTLNEIKSKINIDSSKIDIIISNYRAMQGNNANIAIYKACKKCCDDGATTAKSLSDSVEKLTNTSNSNEIKSLLPKVASASKAFLNMTKLWKQLVTQHYKSCFNGLLKVKDKDSGATKSYAIAY